VESELSLVQIAYKEFFLSVKGFDHDARCRADVSSALRWLLLLQFSDHLATMLGATSIGSNECTILSEGIGSSFALAVRTDTIPCEQKLT